MSLGAISYLYYLIHYAEKEINLISILKNYEIKFKKKALIEKLKRQKKAGDNKKETP